MISEALALGLPRAAACLMIPFPTSWRHGHPKSRIMRRSASEKEGNERMKKRAHAVQVSVLKHGRSFTHKLVSSAVLGALAELSSRESFFPSTRFLDNPTSIAKDTKETVNIATHTTASRPLLVIFHPSATPPSCMPICRQTQSAAVGQQGRTISEPNTSKCLATLLNLVGLC